MARADLLGSYHRDDGVSRRRHETRAERGERVCAVAAGILLGGAELGEGATGRDVDEDGIVAEPASPARRERDRSFATPFHLDDLAVGPRERQRAAKRGLTRVGGD